MIELNSILKQCIVLNRQMQQSHPHATAHLSPLEYRREYKSICLDVGRQTGKTTTVVDFYKQGDLVIVHNVDRIRDFPPHVNTVSHSHFFDDISRRGKAKVDTEHNYIFIDEPYRMTSQNLATLYTTTDAALYIFLGRFTLAR